MKQDFSRIVPMYFQGRFWIGVAVFLLLTVFWLLTAVASCHANYRPVGESGSYEVALEQGSLRFGRDCGYFYDPATASGWTFGRRGYAGCKYWPELSKMEMTGFPLKGGFPIIRVGTFSGIPLWPLPLAWLVYWTRRMVRKQGEGNVALPQPA